MSIKDKFGDTKIDFHRAEWAKNHITQKVPSWDDYFMAISMVVATRSKDSNTKYGCVITRDNKILGTGYNSFLPGLPDSYLPNMGPSKYKFMRHAERNALDNTSKWPTGGTCYIGGYPCLDCLQDLAVVGIKEIVLFDKTAKMFDNYSAEEKSAYLSLVEWKDIKFRVVEPNDQVLHDAISILRKHGNLA